MTDKPMTLACMEAILMLSASEQTPITSRAIAEHTGMTHQECSGAMARNMRREPHLFRKRVGTEYGYWINLRKLNPTCGLLRTSDRTQSVETRIRRSRARQPVPETSAQALNPKGVPMKERAVLSNAESFKLFSLIQAEYTEKRLDDTEFAAYAAQKLGIPKITNRHVGNARKDLDIKSTRDIVRDASKLTIAGRIAALEEKMQELLEKLKPLL